MRLLNYFTIIIIYILQKRVDMTHVNVHTEVASVRGRGLLMTPPILLWSSRSIGGCAGPCPGCC